jgi:hypothetical protein
MINDFIRFPNSTPNIKKLKSNYKYMNNSYSKRIKTNSIDRKAVRKYAQLLEDIAVTKRELDLLSIENAELAKYVWKSQEGYKCIFDISDDHLKNIITLLSKEERHIPITIIEEYRKRFKTAPSSNKDNEDSK